MRQSCPTPDHREDQGVHLRQEEPEADQHLPGAPGGRERAQARLPAAEEQDCRQAAAQHDVRVLRHEKDSETHPGVLGEGPGHELTLRLGHVKGGAVRLGEHADEEDDKGDRSERVHVQPEEVPVPEAAGLLLDDLA